MLISKHLFNLLLHSYAYEAVAMPEVFLRPSGRRLIEGNTTQFKGEYRLP
jgi:hypothetical protein